MLKPESRGRKDPQQALPARAEGIPRAEKLKGNREPGQKVPGTKGWLGPSLKMTGRNRDSPRTQYEESLRFCVSQQEPPGLEQEGLGEPKIGSWPPIMASLFLL